MNDLMWRTHNTSAHVMFVCTCTGAVLSVPLLGVMKILLDETDHPMAKMLLDLIREDKTIGAPASNLLHTQHPWLGFYPVHVIV